MLDDLERAKKMGEGLPEITTVSVCGTRTSFISNQTVVHLGTPGFMSVEVRSLHYRFLPRPGLVDLHDFTNLEFESTDFLQCPFHFNPLHDLESIWWVGVWLIFRNRIIPIESGTSVHKLLGLVQVPSRILPSTCKVLIQGSDPSHRTLYNGRSRPPDRRSRIRWHPQFVYRAF
jgi:hypothetical protein